MKELLVYSVALSMTLAQIGFGYGKQLPALTDSSIQPLSIEKTLPKENIDTPYDFNYKKSLPDLGDPSANTLSVFKENLIGQQFIAAVKQQLPVSNDNFIREYLENLGQRLVAASDTPNRQFHFYLLNIDDINAFAGPGGYICVNSGLVLNSRNESELAAVMAHEISHVRQRHLARMMEAAKKNRLPMIVGLLGAVLAGLAGSPDAAMGAMSATMTASAAHMMSFSRREEQEADNVGMRILYKAGFNPKAMAGFFGKMQQMQMAYGQEQTPSIFMSHPSTPIRIAEAQARARNYPHVESESSLDYLLVKQRLDVLSKTNTTITVDEYREYHAKHPKDILHRYGYALALFQDHQPKAALKIIEPLANQNHHNLFINSLYAQLLANTRSTKAAMDLLEKTKAAYPNSAGLILQQAKTLFLANQLKQSALLLEEATLDLPNNASFFHLLAQVLAAQEQYAKATEAEAEARALNGHFQLALDNLEPLLRDNKLSHYDQLRIQGKITRLKKEIEKMKRFAKY